MDSIILEEAVSKIAGLFGYVTLGDMTRFSLENILQEFKTKSINSQKHKKSSTAQNLKICGLANKT